MITSPMFYGISNPSHPFISPSTPKYGFTLLNFGSNLKCLVLINQEEISKTIYMSCESAVRVILNIIEGSVQN